MASAPAGDEWSGEAPAAPLGGEAQPQGAERGAEDELGPTRVRRELEEAQPEAGRVERGAEAVGLERRVGQRQRQRDRPGAGGDGDQRAGAARQHPGDDQREGEVEPHLDADAPVGQVPRRDEARDQHVGHRQMRDACHDLRLRRRVTERSGDVAEVVHERAWAPAAPAPAGSTGRGALCARRRSRGDRGGRRRACRHRRW